MSGEMATISPSNEYKNKRNKKDASRQDNISIPLQQWIKTSALKEPWALVKREAKNASLSQITSVYEEHR